MALQDMIKKITTNNAPKAIGAYSQGCIAQGMIFTSGQIAIDPKSGILVMDDFRKEVMQVLKNIESVIIAGGSSKDDIIKLTVYIKDITKFKIVNEVFEEFFKNKFPARSVIEVSDLPLGVNIEIEGISLI